ncbi:MAG: three-Cys-motif partner protein TcmP [Ignavibacterium sp.]|jgi:three-Cys-motif partner protein|uniref:three-Cys-motif partner protein TcmP n=1 Tax=Ignavibacterium sp. TaxID=2651167 RepID=UPI003299CBAA
MDQVKEPKNYWGGNWTEEKLEAFEKYVDAYLTIMNAQKQKYNGWPTTIYFDGFAGSGTRYEKTNLELQENKLIDIEQDSNVYQGSAERVLRLDKKFDYYYFVDNDKDAIEELEEKLRESKLVTDNSFFINDDVNNQIVELVKILDNNKAALVLLDPFGMQIDWASIEKLKGKRVDLWILIPSGVIINRFLDRKGKLLFDKKLESYFGMKIDAIKNIFYTEQEVETLFGKESITQKSTDSINKIAAIYVEKLKNIFNQVTETPLILYNTKNVAIYHFVFASNNQTALKIAKQIIEKK